MHYTNAFIRGKKAPFRGAFKYKDGDGNWHQTVRTLKSQGIADARRELTEVRAKLEEEHEQAKFVAKTTMTVGEHVENYINRLDETKVLERSTVNGYLCMLGYIRDIPLTSKAVEWLKDRKSAQEVELVVAGLSPTEERMGALYVLGGVDGLHMVPHTLSKGWKSIADSMCLVGTQGRRPTFHDLRHTFATYAISEGIDVKTVSSILGHSSAAM